MSTFTETPSMIQRDILGLYALEAKTEVFKLMRMPAYVLPTIGFPVVFYILFALCFRPPGIPDPSSMATYLIASYGAFGVIGAALFGFGVGVAVERGQGWLLLKRASPMPPLAYLVAKMIMSLLFGMVIVLSLCALGAAFGGVRLPISSWLGLIGTLALGSIPFSALGLALGFVCKPNSAPAVVNLIYLPASFASGLWIPINMLPGFLQSVALFLPPYHLGQLAAKYIGTDAGQPVLLHVSALLLTTAVSLIVAVIAYRRDEGATYG